jgi:hypothetical protein
MASLYVVLFKFDTPLAPEVVDAEMGKFKDWLRWKPDAWVIYTDLKASEIRERFKKMAPEDPPSMMIMEITGTSWATWAKDPARSWLNKERQTSGE